MNKEIMKRYLQLVKLATTINGFEERKQGLTRNKPTVFIEFAGHVNWLTIRINKNGWSSGELGEYEKTLKLDCKTKEEIVKVLKTLDGTIGELKSMFKNMEG